MILEPLHGGHTGKMRAVGKHVSLFLVDGTPGGLITAEIKNWTGHLLKGNREKLGEIRKRPEAQRTGVYILLGDNPNSIDNRLAYIGQSDDVGGRLQQHHAKKDFWSEVVIMTAKDNNLTSAHVRYLEARLIRLAKQIGRVPLDNGNEPTGGAELPEADQSDMEHFIEQLRVLLPVLGVDIFRGRETRAAQVEPGPVSGAAETAASPVFRLKRESGVDARAQVIDGEFTVLAGSVVRSERLEQERDDLSESTVRQRQARQARYRKLRDAGVIAQGPDGRSQLTRDVVFSSPSQAAAIVQGRASSNGRRAWLTEDGTTFGAWESRDVQ